MKPSERVLGLFVPMMEREGYTYRKSRHSFEKRFPCGRWEYVLGFDGRAGLVGVHAGFFVHFETLEQQFKGALGHECPWSAGGTLLNAGANPWRFDLFEERFATLSAKDRAGMTSEALHPEPRIQAGVQFLAEAHTRAAAPFFQKLQTYRQLFDFYLEYIRNGFSGRCRPLPENVIYLSLLVAGSLGEDVQEIVVAAKGKKSIYAGHDVSAKVQAVRDYLESAKPEQGVS